MKSKNQTIYIVGIPDKSKEIIKKLEDLGGVNINNITKIYNDRVYYINENGIIDWLFKKNILGCLWGTNEITLDTVINNDNNIDMKIKNININIKEINEEISKLEKQLRDIYQKRAYFENCRTKCINDNKNK